MNYKIAFLPQARKDFDERKRIDEKTVHKILEILKDICRKVSAVFEKICGILPAILQSVDCTKKSRRSRKVSSGFAFARIAAGRQQLC